MTWGQISFGLPLLGPTQNNPVGQHIDLLAIRPAYATCNTVCILGRFLLANRSVDASVPTLPHFPTPGVRGCARLESTIMSARCFSAPTSAQRIPHARRTLICSILTEEALWGPFSDAMWPEEWSAKGLCMAFRAFWRTTQQLKSRVCTVSASIAELGVRFSGI